MKHNVFSIYDSKANAYLPPFFLPTVAMAVRAFSDCVNSDDHQFGKHPSDFTLWHLGTWDDATCVYKDLDPKEPLFSGNELKDHDDVPFDETK